VTAVGAVLLGIGIFMPLIRVIAGTQEPGPLTICPRWICLIAGGIILYRKMEE
jgi:hypothetical protein